MLIGISPCALTPLPRPPDPTHVKRYLSCSSPIKGRFRAYRQSPVGVVVFLHGTDLPELAPTVSTQGQAALEAGGVSETRCQAVWAVMASRGRRRGWLHRKALDAAVVAHGAVEKAIRHPYSPTPSNRESRWLLMRLPGSRADAILSRARCLQAM